jgi:Protease subunit of ATP-dependent Clp proteases
LILQIHAREILRLRNDLNNILSTHTGQPLEKIEKDTDRDFFMNAQEALNYGLIDKVITTMSETTDDSKKK